MEKENLQCKEEAVKETEVKTNQDNWKFAGWKKKTSHYFKFGQLFNKVIVRNITTFNVFSEFRKLEIQTMKKCF